MQFLKKKIKMFANNETLRIFISLNNKTKIFKHYENGRKEQT